MTYLYVVLRVDSYSVCCAGISVTVEEAKASIAPLAGCEWYYTHRMESDGTVAFYAPQESSARRVYEVRRMLITAKDPLHQFALAVLGGDPEAVDAVKDVLKL